MTKAPSGIHGVATRDDLGSIYLLSDDVISLIKEHSERIEVLIAKAKEGAFTEEGRIQVAALVGASAVLQSLAQQLELLGIEMATDADIMVQEERKSG